MFSCKTEYAHVESWLRKSKLMSTMRVPTDFLAVSCYHMYTSAKFVYIFIKQHYLVYVSLLNTLNTKKN